MGSERAVVPFGCGAAGPDGIVDVFEVHGLDAGGIVADECHRVVAGPLHVAGVWPEEDERRVSQGEQPIGLCARFDDRTDVIVEGNRHTVGQGGSADGVEVFGEYLVLLSGQCVCSGDMTGGLGTRQPAGGFVVEAARRYIERVAACCCGK